MQSNKVNIPTAVCGEWDSSPDRRFCPATFITPSPDHFTVADAIIHDFNDHAKTRGLAHDFTFIGPDSQIPKTNDLRSYIYMARVIEATGVNIYQMATFPVH